MNDTPRTNAMLTAILETHGHVGFLNCPPTWVALARELERELNEANQRIKRLEEAGDAVAAIIGPPGSALWADENQVDAAWNNWTKAKEAKL